MQKKWVEGWLGGLLSRQEETARLARLTGQGAYRALGRQNLYEGGEAEWCAVFETARREVSQDQEWGDFALGLGYECHKKNSGSSVLSDPMGRWPSVHKEGKGRTSWRSANLDSRSKKGGAAPRGGGGGQRKMISINGKRCQAI